MSPRLPPVFLGAPLTHRGLHDVADGRPENSRAAIAGAIAAGYGIEIDLQLSADDQPMVFHDYALERLAMGKGAVRLLTRAQLRDVQLRGGNEGIPDLAEILALVAGRVPLLVEFKDQDGAMGENVGPLERAAAPLLAAYQGPLAVMSFNPHSVAVLAHALPNVARGIVSSAYRPDDWPLPQATCDRLRDIPDYTRVGASFVSHEVDDLDRARVSELRAAGADVLCWTVKSAAQEAQARKYAQNITFEGYLAAIPG